MAVENRLAIFGEKGEERETSFARGAALAFAAKANAPPARPIFGERVT